MKQKLAIKVARVLIPLMVGISSITVPVASAFFTSPEGGLIVFSIPCVSSMGPGFWTLKANSATPIIYLYPSWTIRENYLSPSVGVTTLGLIGTIIDCTVPTVPPALLTGRLSILYGTALGF